MATAFGVCCTLIPGLLSFGCARDGRGPADPFEYRFERTPERRETAASEKRTVSVRFDGVPFAQAMAILSQEANVPIVWSSSMDSTLAFGTFQGVSIQSVLEVLSRRAGASVAQVGGVYYLGEVKKEDRAFAVVRVPPVDRSELLEALKNAISINGTVSIVGSCVWICDDAESIRKIITAVEDIRSKNERSYVAEVYFLRLSEEHFVRLTADLQIRQIDIFSSAFNMSELFEMFLDGDAGTGWAKIDQRPVLFVPEGRKVVIQDGKEITREQKSMTKEGGIETTGYAKFTDGTRLELQINRVSERKYAVDMNLSISMFDKADKATIPGRDNSSLEADGLQVEDSQVYYVGSLRRNNRNDNYGMFSLNFGKSHDFLTIWLRVREVKASL